MKQINAETRPMVQIWERGEGKANSFPSLCKAPARKEQAQRGGRAQGPPGMLGHGGKVETRWRRGGCTEAGGEMSTGGAGRGRAMLSPWAAA